MHIKIGTRGSLLALRQAGWVKQRLAAGGYEAEVEIIKTTGDKLAEAPLTQSGTKGLFIKEIEEALLAGTVDLAVHSLKDLPTEQPAGLRVAAVPEREDPRDVVVSRSGKPLASLPVGSRVGTSSLRRISQLRLLRQDLEIVPLRGNIDTRLKKLDRGEADALLLAAAGLIRLGLADRVTEYLTAEQMCPAVGQGALAIEIRVDNHKIEHAIASLDHLPTHQAVRAERSALKHLGGGCQVPIAANAVAESEELRMFGLVGSVDGDRVIRARASGRTNDPEIVGATLARDLLRQGAKAILDAI